MEHPLLKHQSSLANLTKRYNRCEAFSP
ncbi:MAG: hypothetical protein ACI8RZ_007873 [Myxococcota bacterium]